MVGARAASHDAAHEIGHGGLHPCKHSTPAGGSGGSAGAAAQGGEQGATADSAAAAAPAAPAALPQWGRRAARSGVGERRAQEQPRGRGLIAAAAGFPLSARRWVNSARRRRLLSHVIARLDLPGRFLLLLRHRRAPGTRRARAAAAPALPPARLPALEGVARGRCAAGGAWRGRPRLPAAVRRGPGQRSGGRSCPRPLAGRTRQGGVARGVAAGPPRAGASVTGGREVAARSAPVPPAPGTEPAQPGRDAPSQTLAEAPDPMGGGTRLPLERLAVLLPLKHVIGIFPKKPFAMK